MTKGAITERIMELRRSLDQIQANGNAIIGAIQECERWLKIIEEATPAAQE